MKANLDARTVTYNVNIHLMNLNNEVVYHFNNKCNSTEALLGTLAVGAVERIKSDSVEKDKPVIK